MSVQDEKLQSIFRLLKLQQVPRLPFQPLNPGIMIRDFGIKWALVTG